MRIEELSELSKQNFRHSSLAGSWINIFRLTHNLTNVSFLASLLRHLDIFFFVLLVFVSVSVRGLFTYSFANFPLWLRFLLRLRSESTEAKELSYRA